MRGPVVCSLGGRYRPPPWWRPPPDAKSWYGNAEWSTRALWLVVALSVLLALVCTALAIDRSSGRGAAEKMGVHMTLSDLPTGVAPWKGSLSQPPPPSPQLDVSLLRGLFVPDAEGRASWRVTQSNGFTTLQFYYKPVNASMNGTVVLGSPVPDWTHLGDTYERAPGANNAFGLFYCVEQGGSPAEMGLTYKRATIRLSRRVGPTAIYHANTTGKDAEGKPINFCSARPHGVTCQPPCGGYTLSHAGP
jgi:hypothetical protein